MPHPCQTVFRQRICHFPSCRTVFYLCRHCDRGQRYCSRRCREKSRRLQRREANRRYQQSPEGRLDHQDRQKAYRLRQRQAGVTDQGSTVPFSCGRMGAPQWLPSIEVTRTAEIPLPVGVGQDSGWVVCQICGRRGRFVNPLH